VRRRSNEAGRRYKSNDQREVDSVNNVCGRRRMNYEPSNVVICIWFVVSILAVILTLVLGLVFV
jgi:hypothetical protein